MGVSDPGLPVEAYAADVAARAYAALGRRSESPREIGNAESNLSRVGDTQELPNTRMSFYTHGQFFGGRSQCLLVLGDAPSAVADGERALALVQPQFVRNLAFSHVILGQAHIADGDADSAADAVASAARLAVRNRSARLVARIRESRSAMQRWSAVAGVRDLDDTLSSLGLLERPDQDV